MSKIKGKEINVEATEADQLIWCRAMVDTKTFNIEDNSVEVVFATDTPCLVYDRDDNPFNQVLSFDPAHVDMDRLENGAPVLNNHKRDDVTKDQIGVVENARIVGNEGRATLRLSKRPSLLEFVSDVKDGIIKGISAGFKVFTYRDISVDTDRYPTLLAVKWLPFEISIIPVGEDAKCHIRSMSMNDINLNNKTERMEKTPEQLAAEARTIVVNEERTRSMGIIEAGRLEGLEPEFGEGHIKDGTPLETFRALATAKKAGTVFLETPAQKLAKEAADRAGKETAVIEERTRSMEIIAAANDAGLDGEFATKHITDGTPLDTYRGLVIKEFAKAQKYGINHNTGGRFKSQENSPETVGRKLGFEEAITIRAFGAGNIEGGPKTEMGKKAANGRRQTLADLGAASLEATGVNTRDMSENDIFTRAMATGDFPITLAAVMNKTLRQQYASADPVWMKFAKKVSAKDFKKLYSVNVDGNTLPGKMTEDGEYPNVKFVEGGDSFALDTYGLTFDFTRKMFINDDLNAFGRFAPLVSDGFQYNQTTLVYAALLGTDGLGRVIGEDGVKVFDAAHNNLASAGTVLSLASLTKMTLAMRRQKTLAGRVISNNKAKFLVVPPDLEILATQLINTTITPNTTSTTNPFKGAFEVLVEDYFSNTTRWLGIADPSRMESVKYATLDGQEGIFTEQWWDHGKDIWRMKSRQEFAATVEEPRGLYNNPGA